MFKHLYRSLPMLVAYGLLSVFLYSVVMLNISNDTKILFDWAQIHTAGFVVLIGDAHLSYGRSLSIYCFDLIR